MCSREWRYLFDALRDEATVWLVCQVFLVGLTHQQSHLTVEGGHQGQGLGQAPILGNTHTHHSELGVVCHALSLLCLSVCVFLGYLGV